MRVVDKRWRRDWGLPQCHLGSELGDPRERPNATPWMRNATVISVDRQQGGKTVHKPKQTEVLPISAQLLPNPSAKGCISCNTPLSAGEQARLKY
jgi:hypothetical protein